MAYDIRDPRHPLFRIHGFDAVQLQAAPNTGPWGYAPGVPANPDPWASASEARLHERIRQLEDQCGRLNHVNKRLRDTLKEAQGYLTQWGCPFNVLTGLTDGRI